MDLTSKQRRHLRALAHHLSPVVMVGNAGVTDGVAEAVDVALTRHELIKVRVDADALTTRLRASEVQVIGHVVVLYRRHPTEPQIALPDLPAAAAPKDPKRLPASRTRVEEPPARPLHRPRGRFNPARGRRSGS